MALKGYSQSVLERGKILADYYSRTENLEALGLYKILAYSAITGISISLAYAIGGDSLIGGGFSVLNSLSRNFDPSLQSVIVIVSAALAIYSVYSLAKFFRQVYENRLYGIVLAALGFFGSLLIILVSHSTAMVLGVSFWLVGIILAVYKNKTKS